MLKTGANMSAPQCSAWWQLALHPTHANDFKVATVLFGTDAASAMLIPGSSTDLQHEGLINPRHTGLDHSAALAAYAGAGGQTPEPTTARRRQHIAPAHLNNFQKNIDHRVRGKAAPLDRKVVVILDEGGCSRKSELGRTWMCTRDTVLVSAEDDKDNLNTVADYAAANGHGPDVIVWDCPRSAVTDDGFCAIAHQSIEKLKNGLFHSPKYMGKITIMDKPHVIVFCNVAPDPSKLTEDRWDVFEVGVNLPADTHVDPHFSPQTREQMEMQCTHEAEEAAELAAEANAVADAFAEDNN